MSVFAVSVEFPKYGPVSAGFCIKFIEIRMTVASGIGQDYAA